MNTDEETQAVTEIKERVMLLASEQFKGMYLFGSKARGDYHAESDVDLAIIIENLTRELKKSIINIVANAEISHFVVISSLVFSEEDYNLLRKRERRIALDIGKEGIDFTASLSTNEEGLEIEIE